MRDERDVCVRLGQISARITTIQNKNIKFAHIMRKERIELYKQLEEMRDSRLLVYTTSTRQNLETQIASDILPMFTEHLDKIKKARKISLFLYTNGGNTLTAWSLVNLIRSFCDEFEVIIPANCFSSGTLICLGANNIVMTKQATLGPIDPSVNGPLNPMIPGTNNPNAKVPVSVEHVNAYIEMAKRDFSISDQQNMTEILLKLSEKIHPITLGQVYKSKSQIQMLARKLMKWQNLGQEKEDLIINFLCSESGSHDYSIHRKEASEELGLNIEKPSEELYGIIKSIYDDIARELDLEDPFNPIIFLGQEASRNYTFRRGLIESLDNGTDVFISEGTLNKAPKGINDTRTIEGWRHENG